MLQQVIKNEIIRVLKLATTDWDYYERIIEVLPESTYGSNSATSYIWLNGEKVPKLYFPSDEEFKLNLAYCIYLSSLQSKLFNKVIFKAEKSNLENADCELIFDQAIVDSYNNFLPKSKRGKIIPWWNIPEQVEHLKA